MRAPAILTDEQRAIQETCREFAAREIRPISLAVDEADTVWPQAVWRKAAEVGLTAYMLPEEYGGAGMTDSLTSCIVQEELSHGCSGIGNLITSGGFFAEPVLALGSPEQKREWLTPLADSANPPLTALAITEPTSGSDAASIRTRARAVDGGYVLSGQKAWISNGGVAECYVVFATVAPGSGSRGITAFLVRGDDPGLRCGPPIRKMGQRAIPNCELFLDDVFVAGERRLGEEGEGFAGLMQTFDRSRVTLAASATGLARAALEYAVDYAKQREQFGRPIAQHQAVAFRLADMAVRVDAARLLTWRAADMLDRGERATGEAAMAKLAASETAMWCTWAAVQTLGGWGYSREYPVEKWMRDAKLEEIEEGTSDIQRLVISRALLR
jgi:alkylation response protein AidB-like acyl-CoA dehydrogenase